MFYDDVIKAISDRDDARLEELFKQPNANANASQHYELDFGYYGMHLLPGIIQLLRNEPDKVIIFYADFLLKKGAFLNIRPHEREESALHKAISFGKIDLVKFLIQKGALLDEQTSLWNAYNVTLLHERNSTYKKDEVERGIHMFNFLMEAAKKQSLEQALIILGDTKCDTIKIDYLNNSILCYKEDALQVKLKATHALIMELAGDIVKDRVVTERQRKDYNNLQAMLNGVFINVVETIQNKTELVLFSKNYMTTQNGLKTGNQNNSINKPITSKL